MGKAIVLGASIAWLVAMAAWAAAWGFAPEAVVGLVLVILGYGLLGALSYGPGRLRVLAGAGCALLTLAVAWATFTHLLLLAGGLAATAGALMRPRA